MTRTAAIDQAGAGAGLRVPQRLYADGLTWRVRSDWRELIDGPDAPNWLRLESFSSAELIKRNGGREVWRVTLHAQTVYAKVYRPAGIADRMRQLLRGPACLAEWRTGQFAARRGIPSVVPIACGYRRARGVWGSCVLITDGASQAVPLSQYWLELRDQADRRQQKRRIDALTDVLAQLIASAHQNGFEHFDMHAGNLLVRRCGNNAPAVLFVDLHAVGIDKPVSDRAVVRNLAQLNQWFRKNASRSQRLRFLKRYLAFRDELALTAARRRKLGLSYRELTRSMDRAAAAHARRLWAKRDRRALRNGKYFAKLRLGGGWGAHVFLKCKHPMTDSRASAMEFTDEQWRRWLSEPAAWIRAARPAPRLKDSHTATVWRAQLPVDGKPLEVICKRSLYRTWLKRLCTCLGRSRDFRTWQKGHALLNRDLPTALPLAVLERRRAGVLIDSLAITEAIPDASDLDALLELHLARVPARHQRRARDQLIGQLVRLFKQLESRGFSHRDMKAANVLVHRTVAGEAPPRLTLIDLTGLSLHRRLSRGRRLQALVRLNVSLDRCRTITLTDRLRFLKGYLVGPGRSDAGWKQLWRELAALSERKRRDKRRRSEWKLSHYGRP